MTRSIVLAFAFFMVLPSAAQSSSQSAEAGTPLQVSIEIVRSAYAIESQADAAADSFTSSFEQSFRSGITKKPNGAAILAQNAAVIQSGLQAVRLEMRKQYVAYVAPRVTEAVAALYARSFNQQELTAIRAYYATPQAQAFLASFRKGTDKLESQNPVVSQYRNSPLGRKENSLNGDVAKTMLDANLDATRQIEPAVSERFMEAIGAQRSSGRKG